MHYFEVEDGARPYFCSSYDEDNNFEYLFYNPAPEINDDQDTEEFKLQEALDWMTRLGITEDMRNWYVSNVFLPPIV